MIPALKAIPLFYRLGAIAIALVMIVSGVGLVHHAWRAEGYAAAVTEQAAANKKAAADAAEDLSKRQDALAIKSKELDDAIAALDAKADADPDGSKPGLNVGLVRGLNTIGGRGAKPARHSR